MADNPLSKYLKQFRKAIVNEIEEIKRVFSKDLEEEAEEVAKEIRRALNEVISEIQDGSKTGALKGYTAVAVRVGESSEYVLPKSKEKINANITWIVTVEPSSNHDGLDLNLFEILDEGRPELPYRDKPYPLPGAASGVTLRTGSRLSNARLPKSGDNFGGTNPFDAVHRPEPRSEGQKIPKVLFSKGPLAAVPAYNLYERAKERAKKRLSEKNLKAWDVVFTGSLNG